MYTKNIIVALCFLMGFGLNAQITIDIHPNFKHSVGGIDTFDRSVFIKVHADTEEPGFGGRNFENFVDLRDTFLNKMDVYMGRNTGGITWQFGQVKEDTNRQGFADPEDLARRGQSRRNSYANQAGLHQYESRNQLIIGAQQRPFFPDGTPTRQGWIPANGTAVGEYMGRYVNEFHGQNGQPKPAYVEIMNEPLYEFVTVGDHEPSEIFQFHNEVADAYRAQNPGVPIGGYVTAFPRFERQNFQRWNDRMKLFMDMSGDKMDYWGIHLYDINNFWQGGMDLYRGSRVEGTMDMMEQYSQLSFNEVKPFLVSEIGGRSLREERDPWTPLRDWSFLKSTTSIMMSLMERPQHILSSLPFVIIKAEWGRQEDGDPYPWRLMRQAFEGEGEEGSWWVFTDIVKFYQLWSDVKGTRIAVRSTDPDIQTNAFVDGHKLHVVLNNLYFTNEMVHLNLVENEGNPIQNIRVKHVYLNETGDAPLLEETNYEAIDSIQIGHDAAMVIEYTFENEVTINESIAETKYYATEYLKPIVANAIHAYQIKDVNKGEQGRAVLRLGMGRPIGTSLRPTVKINGYPVEVPENYMGYDQRGRTDWFGVIDVPVPHAYLKTDNEVTIQYPDLGGHISSIALKVFEESNSFQRTNDVAISSLSLNPSSKYLERSQTYTFIPEISPINVTNPKLIWTSSNPAIATIDEFGKVTAIELGTATISVATEDDNLIAESTIEVVENALPVVVTGVQISPKVFNLAPTNELQMQANIFPVDASNKEVIWESLNSTVATLDENGLLTAFLPGSTQIIGTTIDGGLSDTATINVEAEFSTFVRCNFLPSQIESDTAIGISIDFSTAIPMDLILSLVDATGNVVSEGILKTATGIGTENIILTSNDFPPPGTDYSLQASVQFTNQDGTTVFDECLKDNVTITGNTTSIILLELATLKIYPNPNNGIFNVEIPNLVNKASLQIFSLIGKSILQQSFTLVNNQIDVSALPDGVYLIKVETEDGYVTRRIIKQ